MIELLESADFLAVCFVVLLDCLRGIDSRAENHHFSRLRLLPIAVGLKTVKFTIASICVSIFRYEFRR